MTNTRLLLAGAVALCGVAASTVACSQTAIGVPAPDSERGSASPSSGPSSENGGAGGGAPTVANPVDVSRFRDRPCEFLSSGQLRTLGVKAPSHIETSPVSGKSCAWPGGPDAPSVSIGLLPNPHGLSDTYRLAKNGGIDGFGPVPDVNGFPAVKGLPGNPGTIDCGYTVGFNDTTVVLIQVTNVSDGPACNAALQVARDVTITAKDGA